MADSASELESDTSSIDGGTTPKPPSTTQLEQLQKRLESLMQENRVLKMELETYKMRCKGLQEENRELRKASVTNQARAEQEEEFISNTLLKKIQALKNEKETLARNYEQEEEYLTNDLSRKLLQLRREKGELEQTLEKEQEYQVNKLMRKIQKLEAETNSKQLTLETLRREKVQLENALEQEQESLVNRLWKRMDKLEAEKRMLQEKLDQPVSAPPSPRDINLDGDMASNLSMHIQDLRSEVTRLRNQLSAEETDHREKMESYRQEENKVREENLRLQRKLKLEIERREALCRHLSESESSLEMDDERHFNEMTKQHDRDRALSLSASSSGQSLSQSSGVQPNPTPPVNIRPRNVSSPIPVQSPGSSRPISPGLHQHQVAFSPPSPMRCTSCMMQLGHGLPGGFQPGTSPPMFSHSHPTQQAPPPTFASSSKPRVSPSSEKFVRPTAPPPAALSPSANSDKGCHT